MLMMRIPRLWNWHYCCNRNLGRSAGDSASAGRETTTTIHSLGIRTLFWLGFAHNRRLYQSVQYPCLSCIKRHPLSKQNMTLICSSFINYLPSHTHDLQLQSPGFAFSSHTGYSDSDCNPMNSIVSGRKDSLSSKIRSYSGPTTEYSHFYKTTALSRKLYDSYSDNDPTQVEVTVEASKEAANISFSLDEFNEMTLEKQLMYLMSGLNIEDAVDHLTTCVTNGAIPDRTVLLNMMLQISELGKVDTILKLQDILLEKKLVSNENFYWCLCEAVYHSGRLEMGMDFLTSCFKAGLDPEDLDILFVLLGTMIVKHFNHHFGFLEEFVQTLLKSDLPVPSPRAWLWKCFVLAEKFDDAERLLEEYEDLKKIIPTQVSSIIQLTLPIDFDKEKVLLWLMKLPYIKDGLKASAFHILIQKKCDENALNEAVDYIDSAMDNNMKIHARTIETVLEKMFGEFSDGQLELWEKTVASHTRSCDSDGGDLNGTDGEEKV